MVRYRKMTVSYTHLYPDGAVDSDGDTLNDDSKDFDKKNNEQVEVLSFEDAELGFKTPRGYKFNGWKANDKTYQPGANIRVDTICLLYTSPVASQSSFDRTG